MSNWKEKPLSEYCEFQEGYVNPPKGHSEYFGGDIKWCRAVDINNGYVYSTSQTLTDAGFNSAKKSAVLFKPNTIVITKSGTIGRLGIIKDYMCGNRATINIIPKNNADVEFVFYLLRSRQNEFFDLAVGSVQKNLYVSILEKMMFKFPSLYEQKKIASFFSVIDKKIDINNRINRNLSEQAAAIYKAWFINFEMNNGICPDDWTDGVLGDIAEIASGKRPPMKQNNKTDDVCIPLVGAASIMGYTNTVLYDSKILVTGRVGTHGVIQRFNQSCWPSDNTLVITTDRYEFVNQILLGVDYKSMNRGSTQPLITQGDLKKIEIILPNDAALDEFENLVGGLMSQYEKNVKENAKLSELRDSLLPKLMSGELEVSEIDF